MKQLNFLFGPNSSGKSSFLKAMMFLSKNLFPLNTGRTIYKLSDDVDLGTYKDIVTNNDESRRIVFEFDFEGEYEFPKIEEFENGAINDKYGVSDKPEYENLFKYFEEINNPLPPNISLGLGNDGVIEVFGNPIENCNYLEHKLEPDFPFEQSKYNLTISIEFSNVELDYNFTKMSIKDNIKESVYKYVRKDMRPNEDDGDRGMVSEERLIIQNEIELSKKLGYDNYLDELTFLLTETDFSPEFNLSKVLILKENDFGFLDSWNDIRESESIRFYYETIKFLYFSHWLIPKYLKSLLDLKHIPTTREIPKKIYLLERNEFNPKEYYGLLGVLSAEYFPMDFSINSIKSIITNVAYDELLKTIKSVSDPNYVSPPCGEIGNYKSSYNFSINNNLLKLGFKAFYTIEIDKDIGRIYLIGKNNMKMYMSNSSSGFIQVFPIIACCVLNKINHSKSDLEELNSIKYVKNEFPNNYYRSELETDFHSLLIEQPELHLHPKLQSQLAELFADTIKDANIFSSLFIETHSEHLIRKMQILIARGELDKEKVGVWYFDNSEGTTKIKEMEIEPNGFFKEPWPNGFFDDSANLSWDLLTANKS